MQYTNLLIRKIINFSIISFGIIISLSGNAYAHHAIGEEVPKSFSEGFISGLAHPVIGIDHLLFIITLGVAASSISANQIKKTWLITIFALSTLVGVTIITTYQVFPSWIETVVASTLIVLGVIVAARLKLDTAQLSGIALVSGIFHGNAFGASMIGALPAPVLSYLIGLTIIQCLILAGVVVAMNYLLRFGQKNAVYTSQGLGGICALFGVFFIAVS